MLDLLTNTRYATADTIFKKSIIGMVFYNFSCYITHTRLTVTNNAEVIISIFPYVAIHIRMLSYIIYIYWILLSMRKDKRLVATNINVLNSLSVKRVSIHQELITFHFHCFCFSGGQYRVVEVYDNQRIVHGWINLYSCFISAAY